MTETLSRRYRRPPADPAAPRPAATAQLSTLRGASLYIGALLGPGLLLLPGLAAAEAGPASVLAWTGLLLLSSLFALVFAAFGRSFPSAGGVTGYVAAGLGERAGRAAGWMFLAGVIAGAPVVCLIGAGYVTALTGGGQLTRAGVAALLLLVVLTLAARGLRASSGAQLLLVGLLVLVIGVAVAGSVRSARAANWTPFDPHGWLAVGHAAATLMLSFVGWEAVAPLTTRFADPARQLARVVAIALAVTSVLYLGLAVATIGVLGRGADTLVPLAGLLRSAVGPAGTAGAAVAAVVLTLGTTNAYLNGAAAMAGALSRPRPAGREGDRDAAGAGAGAGAAAGPRRRPPWLLAAVAVAGLLLITLYGLGLASPASLVAVPTALFLAVYLGCMTAAARVLRVWARWAAVPAGLAVLVMLGYCGWALAVPVAVAAASCRRERPAGSQPGVTPGRTAAPGTAGLRRRRHGRCR
ncbi:MAG TPA: amino acid permease [Trebonia sp.]|nr:amino acid permease [Trebonia sp.]